MKAAFLTGLKQLEVLDTPEPKLTKPQDVLLRIHTVGVCGSDVHYYTTGRIGPQVVRYPDTTGHECAATVAAVGAEATGLKVGQRVAVDPLVACGQCDQCRAGRINTCRKQTFLGCPGQAPGALAEYLVMPARSCYSIPDSMSMVQAALVEPFSIALYAQRVARMKPGAKIAILGSGPIGLCVLLACRAAGACTTYVTDLIDDRLAVARQCGADWTGNASRSDVVQAISALEPLGVDLVFECAGRQETLDQAAEILKPGGALLVLGIPETERVSFNIHTFRRNENPIVNIRRQNECVAPAIEIIASGRVNLDPLVTHHFPLTETKQAFDLVSDYRDGIVKAMIHISSQP